MPTYTITGPNTSSMTVDQAGVRTYKETWTVQSSVKKEPALDVLNAFGDAHPERQYYDIHPNDALALLKNIECTQTGDLFFWGITLTWDTGRAGQETGTAAPGSTTGIPGAPTAGPGPGGSGGNNSLTPPNLRPWVVTWGSVSRTRPAFEDAAGNPIVNSAGLPFDPPVELPCSNTTLHITRFRADSLSGHIKRFQDSVNSDVFFGYEAGKVRCTSYKIASVFENNAFFWQYDVDFEIKRDGWNPVKVLDAGAYQLVLKPGGAPLEMVPVAIKVKGQPITRAWPLDGSGGAMELPLAPGATFTYLPFTVYPAEVFADILAD